MEPVVLFHANASPALFDGDSGVIRVGQSALVRELVAVQIAAVAAADELGVRVGRHGSSFHVSRGSLNPSSATKHDREHHWSTGPTGVPLTTHRRRCASHRPEWLNVDVPHSTHGTARSRTAPAGDASTGVTGTP